MLHFPDNIHYVRGKIFMLRLKPKVVQVPVATNKKVFCRLFTQE